MPWYSFSGTDPVSPADYTNVGSTPPTCIGNDVICAIQASDNSGQPIFTTALLQEMVTALQNNAGSTNVLLKLNGD